MRGMYSPTGMPSSSAHNEWLDMLKAWAATAFAYAVFIQPAHNIFTVDFLTSSLLIAALTCGIGFVLHEVAHRVVARYYNAEAHFVASPTPLLMLPILVAFVGFLVLAPGAVWHRGYLSQRQLGLVALAGPVTNMVLALLFILLIVAVASFVQTSAAFSFWWLLLFNGYYINAWLGLFNMLPVDPFDGGKIWRWNKVVYGVAAVVGVLMVFVLPEVVLPLI